MVLALQGSQNLFPASSQALPLVSWSRRLELQGELTELGCRRGGVLFASRPRFTPLCLLLFSDLLLITQPKRWVSGREAAQAGFQLDPCSPSELPLPWAVGSGYRFWTMPIAPWSRPSRSRTHLDHLRSASPFSATTRAVPPTGYSKLHPCELCLFQKTPWGPSLDLSESTTLLPNLSSPKPVPN